MYLNIPSRLNEWGSKDKDPFIDGGQLGDHREHPARNDEIDYSITYNIRVDDRPIEVIFRGIC
jgi:hypothetical protein